MVIKSLFKWSSLSALVSGVLFGIGLVISGMTDTHKVIGFLDIMNWDFDLAFVMAGAIIVAVIPFQIAKKKRKPLLEDEFHIPTSTVIDKKLIIGAMLFGTGWGLYGLCPAPVIVSLLYGNASIYAFFVAMLVGFYASRKIG